MTKAERLARRLHELANEYFAKHPHPDYEIREYDELTDKRKKPAYLYVARGLLRDQAKERRK